MFYAASAVLLRRATILRRTRGTLRAYSLIVCVKDTNGGIVISI